MAEVADEAADLTYRLRSADPDTARYEERIVLHELTQCGLVPPGWLGRGADDASWRVALDRRQKRGRAAVPGVAAEQRGRGCILIEIEERWCEVGAKRLAQRALAVEAAG